MEEAASSSELKRAFNNHFEQTQNQVTLLEEELGIIGKNVNSKKCQAMARIVDEGGDIIDETEKGTAKRNVGLIFADQKAEHYEKSAYGGMVTLVRTQGYADVADILSQTLEEERETDKLLTRIAENHVNFNASREKDLKKN